MIKSTTEEIKEADSTEEKLRKLNERNYNMRISTHVKDAIVYASYLISRYSAPLSEPLPMSKALEFSNLL